MHSRQTKIQTKRQVVLLPKHQNQSVLLQQTGGQSGSSDSRPPAATSAGARAEGGDEQISACVNRVELATNFDFSKVEQVLVSPEVKAVPDEISKNYNFITLLLRARACFLLVGYAYPRDCEYENPLTDWVFVNSNFEETQFHIDVPEP